MSQGLRDALAGLAFAGLGGFVLVVLANTQNTGILADDGVTFRTMPALYGWLLLGMASLLAVRGLVALRRDGLGRFAFDRDTRLMVVRIAATLALTVAYVLLIRVLPFALVTFVFLVVMFAVYGQRRPLPIALVSAAGAAAAHLLFITALGLPLGR